MARRTAREVGEREWGGQGWEDKAGEGSDDKITPMGKDR